MHAVDRHPHLPRNSQRGPHRFCCAGPMAPATQQTGERQSRGAVQQRQRPRQFLTFLSSDPERSGLEQLRQRGGDGGDALPALIAIVGECSSARGTRRLLSDLCGGGSSELARRVSAAHALLSAFTFGTAPSGSLDGGRSLAVQRWRLTLDDSGARAVGARVDLPFAEQGLLHSAAADLYAPLSRLVSSAARQRVREAQASGREALHELIKRVGIAPVEEEHAINVLNAAARLGEVAFYPGSGGASGTPLAYANDHATKAGKAAATLLGVDEAALRRALGAGGRRRRARRRWRRRWRATCTAASCAGSSNTSTCT